MAEARQDPQPLGAVAGVLAAFDKAPIVALGETHRLQELGDFIVALVHHPDFPAVAQAIVVEFGNARHQALVDRFVDGEPIAAADVRRVWRDILSAPTADAPIYEHLFRTVRAINRTLPADRRMRIMLGDPPIDWQHVQSMDDVRPFFERELHLAGVVEQAMAPCSMGGHCSSPVSAMSCGPSCRAGRRTGRTIAPLCESSKPSIRAPCMSSCRMSALAGATPSWSHGLPTGRSRPCCRRDTWIGALSPNLLFAAGVVCGQSVGSSALQHDEHCVASAAR